MTVQIISIFFLQDIPALGILMCCKKLFVEHKKLLSPMWGPLPQYICTFNK